MAPTPLPFRAPADGLAPDGANGPPAISRSRVLVTAGAVLAGMVFVVAVGSGNADDGSSRSFACDGAPRPGFTIPLWERRRIGRSRRRWRSWPTTTATLLPARGGQPERRARGRVLERRGRVLERRRRVHRGVRPNAGDRVLAAGRRVRRRGRRARLRQRLRRARVPAAEHDRVAAHPGSSRSSRRPARPHATAAATAVVPTTLDPTSTVHDDARPPRDRPDDAPHDHRRDQHDDYHRRQSRPTTTVPPAPAWAPRRPRPPATARRRCGRRGDGSSRRAATPVRADDRGLGAARRGPAGRHDGHRLRHRDQRRVLGRRRRRRVLDPPPAAVSTASSVRSHWRPVLGPVSERRVAAGGHGRRSLGAVTSLRGSPSPCPARAPRSAGALVDDAAALLGADRGRLTGAGRRSRGDGDVLRRDTAGDRRSWRRPALLVDRRRRGVLGSTASMRDGPSYTGDGAVAEQRRLAVRQGQLITWGDPAGVPQLIASGDGGGSWAPIEPTTRSGPTVWCAPGGATYAFTADCAASAGTADSVLRLADASPEPARPALGR